MRSSARDPFTTVHTEGGLLPPELLHRAVDLDQDLAGLSESHYHLAGGERLKEAINRSWTRLLAAWRSFQAALAKLPASDTATSLTRERWLLVLFQELGYGRLPTASGLSVDSKPYPISHLWQKTPIHLVGCRLDLDKRTAGVAGAARSSPHGLVQEYLNRSPDHLWGFVSNGHHLRLLRDNASLTRQAYVQFDLGSMMDAEAFSDFALLWLVCHQSRVEGDPPEQCFLEQWSQQAAEQGTRALDTLRSGVEHAIAALGRGFLAHPANTRLREKLREGSLHKDDYYRQLLRLVYRLLFLFVAEDRELLLDPGSSPEAQRLYQRHYSASRLRRLAGKRRGGPHPDLFRALRLVMHKLGEEKGCSDLGLPALGSFLWSPGAISDLHGCDISNRDLLEAVRELSYTEQDHRLRPVDYKNLGAEELGSIYESLLELHPELNAEAATFSLSTAAGHERKTTGSYYTPTSLVRCLLDSALDPVLEEAARKPNPEQAILSLKVCDPACGSGHFLIAAAHRLARRLASVRTGDEEPSPGATRTALRDIIGHCLYGVDVNPMAVELCKVSLWMEALEPGKPLSFLEHHIRCGNSLLGATPALLAKGIPDEAFKPIEGDDKQVVSALKKRNRRERQGARRLPLAAEPKAVYGSLTDSMAKLEALPDDSLEGVLQKEERYRDLSGSEDFKRARLLADAWCAAFVWKKAKEAPEAITQDMFLTIKEDPRRTPDAMLKEIERLSNQYHFFHWHVEYPEIFQVPKEGEKPESSQAGWSGGFDVVLGNPPWEHTEMKEIEWFANRAPDIAKAPNAVARKRLITQLATSDPPLYAAFKEDLREADGMRHLARNSGRFPLCGLGRINTYAIFAETSRTILAPTGRIGCIVPSGIATDDTTKYFFQDIVDTQSLVSFLEFENEGFFGAGKGHMLRFALMTLLGSRHKSLHADFLFQGKDVLELRNQDRHFQLTRDEIALLNPNTRTCPIFETKLDAEITKDIYRRVPVLIKEGPPEENPWGISFKQGLFNMSTDSGLFRTRQQLEDDGWTLDGNIFRKRVERYLPLYEAKMIYQFTHRFGDYSLLKPGVRGHVLPEVPHSRLIDPDYVPLSRYWVSEHEVDAQLKDKWRHSWLLSWRDVTDARASARTTIASTISPACCEGGLLIMLFQCDNARYASYLLANLNSFVFDFVARQKVGGLHLKFFTMRQLPIIPPHFYDAPAQWNQSSTLGTWVLSRSLELAYTSTNLSCFAGSCGYNTPPFRWDDLRRFYLRCELDAAFFHLYGISKKNMYYILNTFPIVKKRDKELFGNYRTSHQILEIYDAMADTIASGRPYQTLLDPPPGDHRAAHPPRRQLHHDHFQRSSNRSSEPP